MTKEEATEILLGQTPGYKALASGGYAYDEEYEQACVVLGLDTPRKRHERIRKIVNDAFNDLLFKSETRAIFPPTLIDEDD